MGAREAGTTIPKIQNHAVSRSAHSALPISMASGDKELTRAYERKASIRNPAPRCQGYLPEPVRQRIPLLRVADFQAYGYAREHERQRAQGSQGVYLEVEPEVFFRDQKLGRGKGNGHQDHIADPEDAPVRMAGSGAQSGGQKRSLARSASELIVSFEA